MLLQGGLTATDPLQLGAQLLGLAIASATAAGLVALGYRWYVRERVPTGLGVLFGLTVVAVYLGTTGALGAVISGEDTIIETGEVLPNLAAFAVGALGSSVGIRAGDAAGTDLFSTTGGRKVDRDVSEIVQTVGRVTSVKLPEEIDDIVGYDPMPDATKETLTGRRFLFPRRIPKAELRERLVSRLKTDYGVGHIDLELSDDGEVTYLAIGSRAAGIGPTLPPSTNAVAIRADPANAASAGDLVQVWEPDPLQRVLTGELRGVAGDVVTVAIDAGDTPKLDPATEYKLVTLPVQDRPDREFASLLRAAEETMSTITIGPESELVGTTIGELGTTVAAITREDESPEPIPSRERVLAGGDIIYVIAKPDTLRRVETAASRQRAAEPATVEPSDDESVATADTADAGHGESDAETTTDTDTGDGESDAETTTDTADAETGDEESAVPVDEETAERTDATPETADSAASDEAASTEPTDETASDVAADDAETDDTGTAADDAAPTDSVPSDTDEALLGEQSDAATPTADDPTSQAPSADEPTPSEESPDTEAGATDEPGHPDDDESVTIWDPDERLDTDDEADDQSERDGAADREP